MSRFGKIAPSAVALAVLTLSACSSVSDTEKNTVLKQSSSAVVEKVNGVPITRVALDRAMKALLAQSSVPQPVNPEILKQATEAALNQITTAELLYQAASKLEVKDLEKQVSLKVAKSKREYASQAEFDKALGSVEMTQKDMEEAARKDIAINNLIQTKFGSQVPVTEDEVKKFYTENKEKVFTLGERVNVSHILVGVPEKATAEARKQAKEKAAALLKRVKGGEDLAAVAKAESSCPSKAQGGNLGTIAKGQTVPAFEKTAFALKAGEISDVVETQYGYHIIKVAQKLPPSKATFEEAKANIVVYLKGEKVRKAVADYVEQLRAKAKIEKV
jgi:peptidyl-prolyl cis-trans isomerase C